MFGIFWEENVTKNSKFEGGCECSRKVQGLALLVVYQNVSPYSPSNLMGSKISTFFEVKRSSE